MTFKLNFEADEPILCFHGPLLYEARIVKTDFLKDGPEPGPRYFIHYKGWKQSWDEWVPETRIMKLTEESLQKQRELQKLYATKRFRENTAASGSPTNSIRDALLEDTQAPSGSSRREHTKSRGGRRRDGATDRAEDFAKRAEIRIVIPDLLKAQLVDDWENVTKNQRIVSLPRTPTVSQLLDCYIAERVQVKGYVEPEEEQALKEVTEGLKLYFDKSLGTILLYRQERQQYADIIKRLPNNRMSDIYGAEHLLRLFSRMPSLIAHTAMSSETVDLLKEHLHHIMLYMQRNLDNLFMSEYDNAPPEYLS